MRWSPRRSSRPARDWRDREPAWTADAAELLRAARRGAARPIVTLAAAALASALVVAIKAREDPFATTVVLRISETGFSSRRGVLARGALRSWIVDVALSRDRAFEVVRERDLYRAERALGRDAAVAELRDDLEIEVFSNYFLTSAGMSDRLRTARIALTYRAGDRERSKEVAMALADKVVDSELEHRRRATARAMRAADRLVERAEDSLERRQRQITEKLFLLEAGAENDPASVEVEVGRLAESLEASRRLLEFAQSQRDELRLKLKAAERKLAHRIEIANVDPPPVPRLSRTALLSCLGAVTFFLSLPLSAIAAGAFDGRVRDREDLHRLGLPVFGLVPAPAPRGRRA